MLISVTELLIGLLVQHALISENYRGLFDKYNSPFLLFYSIALFLLFMQITFCARTYRVVIPLASSTFSVYLIHTNTAFHKLFIADRFTFINDREPAGMFAMLLLISFILYIACTFLDLIRKKVFALSGYDFLVERVLNVTGTIGAKVFDYYDLERK